MSMKGCAENVKKVVFPYAVVGRGDGRQRLSQMVAH